MSRRLGISEADIKPIRDEVRPCAVSNGGKIRRSYDRSSRHTQADSQPVFGCDGWRCAEIWVYGQHYIPGTGYHLVGRSSIATADLNAHSLSGKTFLQWSKEVG